MRFRFTRLAAITSLLALISSSQVNAAVLYGIKDTGTLWTIDPTTSIGTQVNPPNQGPSGIGGLSFTVPEPSADFDGDEIVDGTDFLAWQTGLGIASGATKAQGDADNNGTVDESDLTIWETQYGAGTLLSASAVPEPSTCTLVLAALCLAVGRRQPRFAVGVARRSHCFVV